MNTNLLITGIPRSGTSYLCSLIHKIENYVIINEPHGLSKKISQSRLPIAALEFHQTTREKILTDQAIDNKILDGKLVDDTTKSNKHTPYKPVVSSNDFILGSKNTLGYLARLDQLKRVFPEAPILCCIRNPFDTIASWKESFPHLKSSSVIDNHIVGALNDPYLSDWQRNRLSEINKETNLHRRRAFFWTYLMDWILKNKEVITLVQYEKIVSDPFKYVTEISKKTNPTIEINLTSPIEASSPRFEKRKLLSKDDISSIKEICSYTAESIGYDLRHLKPYKAIINTKT